ncbi:MAG: hypothetical protein PVG07_08750 [Acidobacteriota bacterium]|jgi:hypothetical protein
MSEERAEDHGTLEHAFRETTLYRFAPDEQAALRRFGHLLLELALEGHRVGPEEVPLIPGEIGAVGADLEHLAVYLREVAGHLDHSQVSTEEARLCLAAREWADEMERMAGRMERAVVGETTGAGPDAG